MWDASKEGTMRSNEKLCIPAASFLLLLCALQSAPRAAAQVSCIVTYNCHGSSGCASAVGDGSKVPQRTLSFASAAACTAQARTVGDGTIASCSCGAAAASNAPAAPAGLNPAMTNAAQTLGYALGQQLGKMLFGDPAAKAAADAAAQQNALAAQQSALAAQQSALAAEPLNNSGLYLMRQRNFAGAINEFQQALAIAPDDANIRHNLALAMQQLKDSAVAARTSSALGQFLGDAPPATAGIFGDQLTHSSIASPNASALSLVNLDANVVDLRGTTSMSPTSLKSDSVTELNKQFDELMNKPQGEGIRTVQDQDLDKQFDELYNKSQIEDKQTTQDLNKQFDELMNKAESEDRQFKQFEKQSDEQQYRQEVQEINKQLLGVQETQQKVQDELNNAQPASSASQPHN
jgi:tetratricopeptide (TPR) repeat protein